MPVEQALDQAAGLRCLLPAAPVRAWNLTGARPGVGVTTLVVQLARALAQQGHQVLVLDQQRSAHNVGNAMGLRPRYDLLDALQGERRWSQVLLTTHQGVDVLPMARAARQSLSGAQPPQWQQALQSLLPQYDLILTDALPESRLLPGQRSLLVLDATPEGLMQGYAHIKRWIQGNNAPARSLELALTQTRDTAHGQILFDNLAHSTQHFLNFTPAYVGQFPLDPAWRDVHRGFAGKPAMSATRALAQMAQTLLGRAPLSEAPEQPAVRWRKAG